MLPGSEVSVQPFEAPIDDLAALVRIYEHISTTRRLSQRSMS